MNIAMAALPDIELRLVRAFVVLAEELNFGRAAERLHVTQPTLSVQVRQLEKRLDFALFDRSTRHVALTPKGATLLDVARALMTESCRLTTLAKELRGEPHRQIIFADALYTSGLSERRTLLEAFYARHPQIPFSVRGLWQHEMVQALLRGEANFALVIGMPVPLGQWQAAPTAESIFPDTLPRIVLRREPIGLLMPRELPLARFETTPMAALEGVTIAMLGSDHGASLLTPMYQALGAAGARLQTPPEAHGMGVEAYARQFRIAGVFFGWFGSGGEDDPDMVRRLIDGLHIETELSLLRSPFRETPSADIFWQEARTAFPDALVHEGRM